MILNSAHLHNFIMLVSVYKPFLHRQHRRHVLSDNIMLTLAFAVCLHLSIVYIQFITWSWCFTTCPVIILCSGPYGRLLGYLVYNYALMLSLHTIQWLSHVWSLSYSALCISLKQKKQQIIWRSLQIWLLKLERWNQMTVLKLACIYV